MNFNQNITVKSIQSVLYVAKNNPVGTVVSYVRPEGLGHHELIFRMFGEVKTAFDGMVLQHKPFTVQYLPKGQGRMEYTAKTVETGECIDIFFDTDIPLSETAFCMETAAPAETKHLFEKINQIWLKKDTEYYYEAMAVLYRILGALKRSESSLFENSHYLKIKPAVDLLGNIFCDSEIDYEAAAALCHMSYSYFRRLFTECMGVPPAKYVINKKIEYAKELLLSNHYTVSEISDLVGFGDIYYFSHAFKKITGSAPSQYSDDKKP